ncbi:hypothetical protein [Gordonia sp. (in: high G+C Gram-positive bacteria)]|uniref:hypothetical protein n=1 Tax=Gordonia sp. (in: high G+C Gram-positive bacteria) TaxID=84139 RepID=UPI0026254109|nr:hypothetical protein [Gordonia sp. (in: high G+C Gram-positive bacteria)]
MRLTRGQWQPLIPERWRTVVVGVIPLSTAVVGVDYLMGERGASLTEIERAAPIQVWGAALVASGILTLAGYIGRWRHVAIIGLHLGGALMITLGAGIGVETIDAAGGFRWPWLYFAIGIASWGAALGYWMQVEPPPCDRPCRGR